MTFKERKLAQSIIHRLELDLGGPMSNFLSFGVEDIALWIKELVDKEVQASASFTRKQVVEELGPYCQHDQNCKKWKTDFTYFRHFDPEEECTCDLDSKLREGG